MPPPAKTVKPKRRNRKRKRRAATSSSSSSSDASSESEDSSPPKNSKLPVLAKAPADTSSSSESESSSSESDARPQRRTTKVAFKDDPMTRAKGTAQDVSRSPSPASMAIPSFLPTDGDVQEHTNQEQVLKERFRKFWMASIADGFKDDLEEIRKEPNLNTARLSLLIDSLASGADVFNSSAAQSSSMNEMQVILE